jgi:pSer/pThr/pTyr-binding forkhead associated (FHA) protein
LASLTIVEKGRKRLYDICEDVVRIGASKDNNIELQDDAASRNHCEIRKTQKGYRLIDLESKSGTRVNGEFVNQHALEPGDRVEVGQVVLVFDGPKPVTLTRPAPATGRAAPRSSRRGDDDDRPRRYREPEGLSATATGWIVGAVAVGIIAIVFFLIQQSGKDDPGVTEIRQARALFDSNRYVEAVEKLQAMDGIRNVPDWAVREKERLLEEAQGQIDAARDHERFQEAILEMNAIRRLISERPLEVAEFHRRLKEVEQKYKGPVADRMGPEIERLREKFPLRK